MTFRARLTLLSAIAIALVLVTASFAAYVIVQAQLRSQVDDALIDRQAGVLVTPAPAPQTPPDERPTMDVLGGTVDSVPRTEIRLLLPDPSIGDTIPFAQIVDRRGRILVRSQSDVRLPVSAATVAVARGQQQAFFADATVGRHHLRMRVTQASPGRALVFALPLNAVDDTLRRLAATLAMICVAGAVLAGAVGAAVASRALRPIQRLTDATERISATRDLSHTIEVRGRDELSRLASSFNRMVSALDDALRSQRQLVSDASHELRTPLTSLTTNIELLRSDAFLSEPDRRELLDDLVGELDELTRLVSDVVDLARGSQRELHLADVELDSLCELVVARHRSRWPTVDFVVEAERTTVVGDASQIDRALSNLVENAAKWSPPGGTVRVVVTPGCAAVIDEGPGVPPEDQPLVFDRFYRAAAARSMPGSGLGLAIVRQIAEAHGGAVDVHSPPTGGSTFLLSLVESRSAHGSRPDLRSSPGP